MSHPETIDLPNPFLFEDGTVAKANTNTTMPTGKLFSISLSGTSMIKNRSGDSMGGPSKTWSALFHGLPR